jgi:hypothetical protein
MLALGIGTFIDNYSISVAIARKFLDQPHYPPPYTLDCMIPFIRNPHTKQYRDA